MERLLLLFLFVLTSWGHGYEEQSENFAKEIKATKFHAPRFDESVKYRTFYDYQAQAVAYKDLSDSVCYVERIKLNYSNKRKEKIKPTSLNILQSEFPLSKNQVWALAGQRIYEFCRGYPTYFLQTFPNEVIDNDIKTNDIYEVLRAKRSSNNYGYGGRVRGQTQSQYLNYGNTNPAGKAEAESSVGGTRAVVSGTSGMGQAQSQSLPLGCEGCYGADYDRQQQVLHLGRPGARPIGEIKLPGRPGDAFYRPGERPTGAGGLLTNGIRKPGEAIGPEGGYPSGVIPGEVGRPGVGPGISVGYVDETGRPIGPAAGYNVTGERPIGPGGAYFPGTLRPGEISRPTGPSEEYYAQRPGTVPTGSEGIYGPGGRIRPDGVGREPWRPGAEIPTGQPVLPDSGRPGGTDVSYRPGVSGENGAGRPSYGIPGVGTNGFYKPGTNGAGTENGAVRPGYERPGEAGGKYPGISGVGTNGFYKPGTNGVATENGVVRPGYERPGEAGGKFPGTPGAGTNGYYTPGTTGIGTDGPGTVGVGTDGIYKPGITRPTGEGRPENGVPTGPLGATNGVGRPSGIGDAYRPGEGTPGAGKLPYAGRPGEAGQMIEETFEPTRPDGRRPTGTGLIDGRPIGPGGVDTYRPGVSEETGRPYIQPSGVGRPGGQFSGTFSGSYGRPGQRPTDAEVEQFGRQDYNGRGGQFNGGYKPQDGQGARITDSTGVSRPGVDDSRGPSRIPTGAGASGEYRPNGYDTRGPLVSTTNGVHRQDLYDDSGRPLYSTTADGRPLGQFSGKFAGDYTSHQGDAGKFTGQFTGQYGPHTGRVTDGVSGRGPATDEYGRPITGDRYRVPLIPGVTGDQLRKPGEGGVETDQYGRPLVETNGKVDQYGRPIVGGDGRTDQYGRPITGGDGRTDQYGRPITGGDGRVDQYGRPITGGDGRTDQYGRPISGGDGRPITGGDVGGGVDQYGRPITGGDGRVDQYGRPITGGDGRTDQYGRPITGGDGRTDQYGRPITGGDGKTDQYGRPIVGGDGKTDQYGRPIVGGDGRTDQYGRPIVGGDGRTDQYGRPIVGGEGGTDQYGRPIVGGDGRTDQYGRPITGGNGRTDQYGRPIAGENGRTDQYGRPLGGGGAGTDQYGRPIGGGDGRTDQYGRPIVGGDGRTDQYGRPIVDGAGRTDQYGRPIAGGGGQDGAGVNGHRVNGDGGVYGERYQYPPSSGGEGQVGVDGGGRTGGRYGYGGGAGYDNDSDSQAQSSVQHLNNETQASASAQGRYFGGTAQSQVSGVYSGSGSFSASAGSLDGKRGAQTQVAGGKEGATSSAQGVGGIGQSQSQVQIGSNSGDTQSSAQSSGYDHGTNTQVQAGGKGGMADAQANGLGSTSSQAQIGFSPYDKNEKDDQKTPFRGGGLASAQSGSYTGQSQAQIQGKFRYGIKYTGAAQAGSGSNATTSRNQTRPEGLSAVFQPFKPVTYTSGTSYNEQSQHASATVNQDGNIPPVEEELQETVTTTEVPYVENESFELTKTDSDDYYDMEEEAAEEMEMTQQPYTRTLIRQASDNQRQHIILDPLEDLDAIVTQDQDSDFPGSGVLQPGEHIPGSPGYKIPQGFRGKLSSTAGDRTSARGPNSQAQSVTLTPGTGRITYKKPIYTVLSNTQLRNGGFGYGTSYTYQPVQYHLKSGKSYPRFVSVAKTESGSQNIATGKKTPSVYYTQTSTCGYFTNTCVYNNGKKICLPRPKTNPDGSPIKC